VPLPAAHVLPGNGATGHETGFRRF
jgi:hypothetical protein